MEVMITHPTPPGEKSCGDCGWTWHITRAIVNAGKTKLEVTN
ncbi:hypothetical protein PV797_14105 [Clostridiaceae bacterium M8S5]|nr:hypothetical protein PV797_14105 [Clostridiaceae bacterium M8S5]